MIIMMMMMRRRRSWVEGKHLSDAMIIMGKRLLFDHPVRSVDDCGDERGGGLFLGESLMVMVRFVGFKTKDNQSPLSRTSLEMGRGSQ